MKVWSANCGPKLESREFSVWGQDQKFFEILIFLYACINYVIVVL